MVENYQRLLIPFQLCKKSSLRTEWKSWGLKASAVVFLTDLGLESGLDLRYRTLINSLLWWCLCELVRSNTVLPILHIQVPRSYSRLKLNVHFCIPFLQTTYIFLLIELLLLNCYRWILFEAKFSIIYYYPLSVYWYKASAYTKGKMA